MPKVAVYNLEGSQTGELTLSDEIFASDINKAVIHSVVRAQLANKRQGTKSALTRTEVRGGRQEALPPEGDGPCPPGFHPRSPIHQGRRGIRAKAPFFPHKCSQEG